MMDKKTEMTDIINAGTRNTEYKASIQIYKDGETNMLVEAKKRMLNTNLQGKNNVTTPIEAPILYTGNYHQYSTSMMRF